VGERYHNSSNIRENYERPWYTHDLTISKSFKFRRDGACPVSTMKISAEINNVFDQQYDVVLNYPMPGRNYKIILKMDI
jgi:outer membrane receptor protein involved in Fe transport